jgi:glyoxylase-like metal-dependent hydrolase (beta-lactamase superfamily II)
MTNSFYKFKLGDFECSVINDGKISAPVENPGPGPQKNSFRYMQIDILTLLIKTKNKTLLLDTGWGTANQMEPQAGLTLRNLKSAGISPEEIDAVIISHGHIDHIGGTVDAGGNLTFPNARYYMCRKEWEFWTSDSDFSSIPEDVRQSAVEAAHRNLVPLKDKMVLLDAENEILPGISFIKTPGHSPGLIVLILSSKNERLVCLSDSFHRTTEIENPGQYIVPPMTGEADASRASILSQIKPQDLVYGGHFPFPGLGHIVYRDNNRVWEPVTK